ncbi:MAG: cytochrome c [Nannocystaceae bacterium]
MRIAFFALAALVTLAPACNGSSADVDNILMLTGDADNGATLYSSKCASCHGAMGEGGIGTALTKEAPEHSDDDIVTDILEGISGTQMVGFRDQLSDQEVADLLAFIRRDFG